MNEQRQLPMGLSIGVILIFITMVLGVCLLVVFLYNLPVLFPPPGANNQVAGIATLEPTPTPIPATPTALPPPSATQTPTPSAPPSITFLPTAPTAQSTVSAPPAAAPSRERIIFVT